MKFRSVAHYNGGDTVTALQKRTAHCAFCLMPTPTAALEACVMIFKWMEVRMRMCMCVCMCMIFLCQDVRRTHVQTVAAPRLVQTDAPTAALDMHISHETCTCTRTRTRTRTRTDRRAPTAALHALRMNMRRAPCA